MRFEPILFAALADDDEFNVGMTFCQEGLAEVGQEADILFGREPAHVADAKSAVGAIAESGIEKFGIDTATHKVGRPFGQGMCQID